MSEPESGWAAKLLFQWRPVRGGVSRRRRVCEERIVLFSASSPETALAQAKAMGVSAESNHPAHFRAEGHVFFEFVGVLQLIEAHREDDGEVWHEYVEMLDPMERRATLIPSDEDLIKTGGRSRGKRKLQVW